MSRISKESLQPYLAPACRPWTLDSFGNRRLILAALRAKLPCFYGAVLDVGCGEKPYRQLLLSPPSRATSYVGLDLPGNPYSIPDVTWNGSTIPLAAATVDCVLLTEVLEHCPEPLAILEEAYRVLKPGGFLFLTVPFIWPIHAIPHDEFRYTPFALERFLKLAGFRDAQLQATGGRDAVLAVTLGLWVRRRPLTSRVHILLRAMLSVLLMPMIWLLLRIDVCPEKFDESTMIVGLSAAAYKSE